MSQLPLWGNSFGNLVKTSTNSPIIRHVEQKRYLTSFRTNIVRMGINDVKALKYKASVGNQESQ